MSQREFISLVKFQNLAEGGGSEPLKIIKFRWREDDGSHSLDIEFPKMWPFQIEEIEGIAAKWGFDPGRSGRLTLGTRTGNWAPPESAEAIPALRNALADMGYATLFDGEEFDPTGPYAPREG